MFTPDQIKDLQAKTIELIQQINKNHFDFSELDVLKKILRFHEYRYYIMADPLISDFEYDVLFKQLQKIEAEYPQFVTSDSPTQRIGKGLNKSFPTVQHIIPMLSLDNSYNAEDLKNWDRKAKELTGEKTIEYSVEPKFDGAGISLIYENDLLVRGATRGDGIMGDDITTNIKQIKSIPLSASFSSFGIHQIEIRGEVLITKSTFKKYNEERISGGLPPLANPRNAAAGTLRMIDPKEVSKRGLEAFLYHISDVSAEPGKELTSEIATHSGSIHLLWQLGFRSPKNELKTFKSIEDVISYCMDYEARRDELAYEIDGMVIKVNDLALQDKMGMTTHHPRWAIAFKFKARQATSKLKSVAFQVGRTGTITPVAIIDPVFIGGVTVTNVSLFNEDVIKEKDLKTGDTVLVERAGDVIPYIVRSQQELRDGSEKEIIFPTHCPVCSAALHKEAGEAAWRCINPSCRAQVVERLIHFVSKNALDIKSFGEANINRFFDLGLLENIPDIYHLDFEKIKQLEGFGKKSIENLQIAIEESKNKSLNRLIYALGIRYVGETTAKTLANAVNDLMDLQSLTVEQLMALEDIGPKVAESVFEFFHSEENLEMLEKLATAGVSFKNEKNSGLEDHSLQGQTFVFTGTLSKLKRSEAEALVESHGGKILSGVSSKLNYLVAGEDAGSKLEKAKKLHSVKIISEQEFIDLINKK